MSFSRTIIALALGTAGAVLSAVLEVREIVERLGAGAGAQGAIAMMPLLAGVGVWGAAAVVAYQHPWQARIGFGVVQLVLVALGLATPWLESLVRANVAADGTIAVSAFQELLGGAVRGLPLSLAGLLWGASVALLARAGLGLVVPRGRAPLLAGVALGFAGVSVGAATLFELPAAGLPWVAKSAVACHFLAAVLAGLSSSTPELSMVPGGSGRMAAMPVPRPLTGLAIALLGALGAVVLQTGARLAGFVVSGSFFTLAAVLALGCVGFGVGVAAGGRWAARTPVLGGLLAPGLGLAAAATAGMWATVPGVEAAAALQFTSLTDAWHRLAVYELVAAGAAVLLPAVAVGGALGAVLASHTDRAGHAPSWFAHVWACVLAGAGCAAAAVPTMLWPLFGLREALWICAGAGALAAVAISRWLREATPVGWRAAALAAFAMAAVASGVQSPGAFQPVAGEILARTVHGADATLSVATAERYEHQVYRLNNLRLGGGRRGGFLAGRQGLWPVCIHGGPKRAAVLGFAGYEPLEALRAASGAEVTLVEASHAVRALLTADGRLRAGGIGFAGAEPAAWIAAQPADTFDAVIANWVPPWVLGKAARFAPAYFRAMRAAIKPPAGIVIQWVYLHQLAAGEFRTLIAGFREVFPNTFLFWADFDPLVPVMGLLGVLETNLPSATAIHNCFASPERSEAATRTGLIYASEILASFTGGPDFLKHFVQAHAAAAALPIDLAAPAGYLSVPDRALDNTLALYTALRSEGITPPLTPDAAAWRRAQFAAAVYLDGLRSEAQGDGGSAAIKFARAFRIDEDNSRLAMEVIKTSRTAETVARNKALYGIVRKLAPPAKQQHAPPATNVLPYEQAVLLSKAVQNLLPVAEVVAPMTIHDIINRAGAVLPLPMGEALARVALQIAVTKARASLVQILVKLPITQAPGFVDSAIAPLCCELKGDTELLRRGQIAAIQKLYGTGEIMPAITGLHWAIQQRWLRLNAIAEIMRLTADPALAKRLAPFKDEIDKRIYPPLVELMTENPGSSPEFAEPLPEGADDPGQVAQALSDLYDRISNL